MVAAAIVVLTGAALGLAVVLIDRKLTEKPDNQLLFRCFVLEITIELAAIGLTLWLQA